MKLKVMAMALAAGLTFTAFPGVLPKSFDNAGLVAEAATIKECYVPVTLQKFDNPADKSMGNAALIQMGKVVVDNEGKATLQLSFQSLTYSGQTGYMGFFRTVDADGEIIPATVLEEYTGFTDIYNDMTSQKFDKKLYNKTTKTAWYPKTVSIPVNAVYDNAGNVIGIDTDRIKVQVYVPVMEAISSGTGTQFAYLDVKNGLFTGSQVVLDGSIKMNTYFNISDSFVADTNAKIEVSTPDGRKDTFPISKAVKGTEANQYYVTTKIPAKEMTTDLTCSLIDGNGNAVDSFTTNLQDYAQKVIASDATNETKILTAELLNYGSRAQVYFNYNYDNNDENLANYVLSPLLMDTYEEVEASDLAQYTYSEAGTMKNMTYFGTTLSFLSEITMRHYFKLSSGDIKNHTFKIGNTTLTPQFDSAHNAYYVDITGISAKDLDTEYALTVDGTYTLTYSALDYCNAVVTAEKTATSEKVKIKSKNLVKALYKYWQAAENV